MFGIGLPELAALAVFVVLAVVVLRGLPSARWVKVDDVTSVPLAPADLDAPLLRLLDNLPASRVSVSGPGSWMLTVTRAHGWAVVLAVVLFPLGLLFLLAREHADLHVSVTPHGEGAEVRVLGTTRRSLAEAIGEAVRGLA